jgi:hypothetical protein
MINCPKCKRENVDHTKFCYRCYARLTTPEPAVGTPSPASVPRPAEKGPVFESISAGMSKVKEFGREAGRTAETLARMGAPAKRQWNGCLEYLSNLFRRFREVLSRRSQRVKEEPKRRVLLRSKEELQRISREVPKRISEVEPKAISEEEPKRIAKQGPQGISREEPQRISKVEPQKIRHGTQGIWMTVGGLSFRVLKSEWVETLSAKKVLDKRPDASFLSILLTVRNDGKAPMTIPSFGLIDEGEAEYETFEKGWLIDNWLGRLERLNPGVGRSGVIVFDVPQAHRYRLKVLGGLWSQEYALIELEI